MNDNLSDVIIISVMWIAAGAVGVVTESMLPFIASLMGTGLYVALSR